MAGLKSKSKPGKFRETRYPHNRSEGMTVRRSNGATKVLIKKDSK